MGGKLLLLIACIYPLAAFSQNKADRKILGDLQHHISRLSDDTVTGAAGTAKVLQNCVYIGDQFRAAGALPGAPNNSYLQMVILDQGRKYMPGTGLSINDIPLAPGKDFIPLSWSAQGKAQGEPLIAVQEQHSPWIMDIHNILADQPRDTDSSLEKILYKLAGQAVKDNASAVLFYNSDDSTPALHFDPEESSGPGGFTPLNIPVLYVNNTAARKYFKDPTASVSIQLQVSFSQKKDTTYNVIAHIDNHAPGTIIVGAHDIGDKAALIELARLLKGNRRCQKMNYLFISFPEGKNGRLASQYFSEHPTTDLSKVNCVINMDGTGKVSSGSPGLQIAGTGSSPAWPMILGKVKEKKMTVHTDTQKTASVFLYKKNLPFLSLSADGAGAINDGGMLNVVKYLGDVLRELNSTGKIAANP